MRGDPGRRRATLWIASSLRSIAMTNGALRLPGVGDVARPAARRKEQHVDAHVLAGAGVAVAHGVSGGGHPAQTVVIDSHRQCLAASAPLHLDECHGPAAPGDQVDLAARRLHAPGHYSPALEPQPPCRQRLTPAAAALRLFALHAPRSSSARAYSDLRT